MAFVNIIDRFNVGGYGYLTDIICRKGECLAKLKAIAPDSPDELWIEAEIQGLIQDHLYTLLHEVKMGRSVIVHFKAKYRKLAHSIVCNTPEDPEHILVLNCKLFELNNCFIDNKLVSQDYFRLAA